MSTKTIRMTDGTDTILPESAESGPSYCKMADGTLIQWGWISNIDFSTKRQFAVSYNLSIPFVNSSYFVSTNLNDSIRGHSTGMPNIVDARPETASRFQIMCTVNQNYDSKNTAYWIAIGRWK